jgi:hypothetical protein
MMDRIWVTRDKRSIPVSQMATSHIQNSIAMILRCKRWRRGYLPRLYLELEIRKQGLRL